MFIPFLGSLIINFQLDMFDFSDLYLVGSTFGYFLLIFAVELGIVYLYFSITNRYAMKHMDKYRPKK